MANVKTNTSAPVVTDEMLLAMLMHGNNAPSSTPVLTLVSNAAAKSMDTAAVIGGALMGAAGNAKQRFTMERNFRQAERGVDAHVIAAEYLARLKSKAQG